MSRIVVLGIFVADTTYRADRLPRIGETILGKSFALGPGGKGSNQAVAAARAGGDVAMITKLGRDPFADMALDIWAQAGVTSHATHHEDSYTGAACIFVEDDTGNNAIVVAPGVAATLCADDIDSHAETISDADVFLTQLEQPIDAAHRALQVARAGGAVTILNPAPAAELSDDLLRLCDYITPNESEAEGLTGVQVRDPGTAKTAAEALIARGVGRVVVTLGEQGALYHDGATTLAIPAISAGTLVETTGAGDAFNGGLAVALAEGKSPENAMRFATATAALSVTRAGAASSMPDRAEIDTLIQQIS